MSKSDYNTNPIDKNNVIKFTTQNKNKTRLVDGKWQKSLEEFEPWISTYAVKEV